MFSCLDGKGGSDSRTLKRSPAESVRSPTGELDDTDVRKVMPGNACVARRPRMSGRCDQPGEFTAIIYEVPYRIELTAEWFSARLRVAED